MSAISSTSGTGGASSNSNSIVSAAVVAAAPAAAEPPVPVVVSLAIPLLPPEKLYPTPSILDGLPHEVEFDLRLTGCELIQTAGRLLKLPQTAMASGQILFHRYFYTKSFVKSNMEHHAMAAIFLSSKIQECPRRIRDVMNVFHHIKQLRSGKVIKPMPIDANYSETKNKVIKAERQMLKDLGFCVHFKHPHKIIFIYLQAIECSQSELSQKAWNYMNDSLRTDIFLRYTPQKIACACIYLSARELKISLPENPPWFVMFGADEETIKAICVRILHLYTHQVKPQEELEKIVIECRDKLYEDKRKAREAAAATSAPAATPAVAETPKVEEKPPSTKTADAIIQEAKKLLKKEDESKTAGLTHTTSAQSLGSSSSVISNLRAAKAHSNTPPPIAHPKYPSGGGGHDHPMPMGAYPPPYYNSQPGHSMTRHASFNNNNPGHFYSHMPPHHHASMPPYMNGHGGGGGPGGYHHMYGENGYYEEGPHYMHEMGLKKNKSASSLTHYRDHDDAYHKRHSSIAKSSSSRRHGTRSRSRSRSRTRSRSPKRHGGEKRHHHSRSHHGRHSSSKGRSDSSSSSDSDNHESKSKRKKSSHRSSHHKDDSKSRGDAERSSDRYKSHERDRHDKDHHHSSSSSSRHHGHHRSHKSSKSKRDGSSSRREHDEPTADSMSASAAASNGSDSRYMPVCIQ